MLFRVSFSVYIYTINVINPFPSSSNIVIYEGLYFDLAQGQMNGAPNETRTQVVI